MTRDPPKSEAKRLSIAPQRQAAVCLINPSPSKFRWDVGQTKNINRIYFFQRISVVLISSCHTDVCTGDNFFLLALVTFNIFIQCYKKG